MVNSKILSILKSKSYSITILIIPFTALLNANGSFEPVGILPILNSPISVSSLIEIDKIEENIDDGSLAPSPKG